MNCTETLGNSAMSESCEEILPKSKHAGVVFSNVDKSYPQGRDILCKFMLKSSLAAGTRDWIGIFFVSWSTPARECTYQWCSNATKEKVTENGESVVYNTVFPASSLPQQEDEFYQFCYVTGSGEVRGASVPFQIKRPYNPDDDIENCECEDDERMPLTVVSNTANVDECFARAEEEVATLKSTKETLQRENNALKEAILKLEVTKTQLVGEGYSLKNANQVLSDEHKREIAEMLEKCNSLKAEVLTLTEKTKCEENSSTEIEERSKKADGKTLELNQVLKEEIQRNDEANKNKEKLVVEKMQFLQTDDRKLTYELRGNFKKFQAEISNAVEEELIKENRETNAEQIKRSGDLVILTRDVKELKLQATETEDTSELRAVLRCAQEEQGNNTEWVKAHDQGYKNVVNERGSLQRDIEEIKGERVIVDQAAIQQAEDEENFQIKEEIKKLKKKTKEPERTVNSMRKEKEDKAKCLTDQIKQPQQRLNRSERECAEVEALRLAYLESEEKLEKLRELAVNRIRECIEERHVLEKEVEHWKQETQMHVNAAVKFVKNGNDAAEKATQTEDDNQIQREQQPQQERNRGFHAPPCTYPCGWAYVHFPPNFPRHAGPPPPAPSPPPPAPGPPPPAPVSPELVSRGCAPLPPSNPPEDFNCCPVCGLYFPLSKQRELEEHCNRLFDGE